MDVSTSRIRISSPRNFRIYIHRIQFILSTIDDGSTDSSAKSVFPGDPAARFGRTVAMVLTKYAAVTKGSQYHYLTSLKEFERTYHDLDHRIPTFESRLFRWDFLECLYRHRIFGPEEVDLTPGSLHLADGGEPGEGVSIIFSLKHSNQVKIGYLGDKLAHAVIEQLPEEKDKPTVWLETESLLCNMQKTKPVNVRDDSRKYFEGNMSLSDHWDKLKQYYKGRLVSGN